MDKNPVPEMDEITHEAEDVQKDEVLESSLTDVPGEEASPAAESDPQQAIIEEQNRRIEELEKELLEYKDSYIRLMAEFDNYKKRTAREKEGIYSNACADVVSAFLPVMDTLELAMNSINSSGSVDSIRQGVEMLMNQVLDVFRNLGVEEIPALGEKFDHNLHEAVMHVEDENYDENVVVEVLKKGYRLKDKVLRHSVVKVAN